MSVSDGFALFMRVLHSNETYHSTKKAILDELGNWDIVTLEPRNRFGNLIHELLGPLVLNQINVAGELRPVFLGDHLPLRLRP